MSNSSNSEPKFSTQVEDPSKPDAPKHQHGLFEAAKDKFSAHQANPGPVLLNSAGGVPQEGTKEERRAKAEALNKDN
ncbi:hypothetical protein SPBR_02140 [Sporothrix brasiliensis 5110]|uniref:Uncharacterized protein n=1 Tax=Sporothrix brasiliensis 5110 TaxID=1398154 RepID=A0A0C2EXX2_9PEZI|nr:uncharacterized protein SPBR_02140 [Sporothrix brasiliensis 5110]KIH91534.1 hypothetical protein SPBR_02140 [Sporothrix brasiliensis 5110]